MRIYYDADCSICEKMKNFTIKYKKDEADFEFLKMRESIYKNEVTKTILVLGENGNENRYGAALKTIFSNMKLPFYILSYLPIFILDIIYVILRSLRSRSSKNNCELDQTLNS